MWKKKLCNGIIKNGILGCFANIREVCINGCIIHRFWRLLLEKGLQKQDLVEHAGLSSATVAKMGKGEPVSNKVLEKICVYLDCSVNDIICYK